MKLFLVMLLIILCQLGVARTAPNFRAPTLTGEWLSLKDQLKPKRALFLSFWASWCTPCLQEMLALKKGLKENPDLPLEVLTVNVDSAETFSDVKPILKAYEIKFPTVLDPKHQIFSLYQTEKSLPFSVLLDSRGNLIESFNGFHEGMFNHLKRSVKKIIGPDAT